jgi:hypothetical protein
MAWHAHIGIALMARHIAINNGLLRAAASSLALSLITSRVWRIIFARSHA